MRDAAKRAQRPAHLGPLEISITPARGTTVDVDTAKAYADLGVHQLILARISSHSVRVPSESAPTVETSR